MEFTPALSAFQGVMISADSVHSFSKLAEKGGNEKKIEYVIECIRNFLVRENYIVDEKINEEHVEVLRKFAFYIILNSDLTILEEIFDFDGIDFVIWTIPTVKRCLMCYIFWNLNMEQFVYEMIAYSSPYMGLEVATAFLENFKYLEPTKCLSKLKNLSEACYKLLARLAFFNMKVIYIKEAYSNFQKFVKIFINLPNKDKLSSLSNDNEYRFIGERLHTLLLLVLDIFTYFTTEQKKKTDDFLSIYELSFEKELLEGDDVITLTSCNNSLLLKYLNKCHVDLLDVCKTLVMEVSVDIFCAWTEFEENGKSMQQNIGDLCFKVHTALTKISSIAEHPVISMLQQMSTEPLSFKDVINKTDPNTIVDNIKKGDDESSQWIKALIYRDKLCEDYLLLEQLSDHLEVLSEEECYKLFKITTSYLKDSCKSNKELIQLVIIDLFQQCTTRIKYEIIEKHFSNETFNNSLETVEFESMSTEIFNKLIISPDNDFTVILCLFLQNPKRLYHKIFSLASENTHQTNIMNKAMQCLDRFSKHYYAEETESSIISIINETFADLDTDEKKNNFIKFLTCIKSNAITGSELLLLIIMPNLHNGLLNKNIDQIYVQCKLLQEAYTLNELIEYRAPILAMLAQVLDTVRWKVNTYSTRAPPTLELVIQLQTSLLNTYGTDIPEKECVWLKRKLRNIKPLNMYYFRLLWNPPGNTFVEVTSGVHIHKDMDMEHLVLWLSQVISSTVLKEWYDIWDSLLVFGMKNILIIFHKALILLCKAERANHTDKSGACVLYCIKNYVAVVRYKFFKSPLKESDIKIVVNKLAAIENLLEDSSVEELHHILLPLLSYIAEKKDTLDTDLLQSLHSKFKHEIIIDAVNKLFNKKMVTE